MPSVKEPILGICDIFVFLFFTALLVFGLFSLGGPSMPPSKILLSNEAAINRTKRMQEMVDAWNYMAFDNEMPLPIPDFEVFVGDLFTHHKSITNSDCHAKVSADQNWIQVTCDQVVVKNLRMAHRHLLLIAAKNILELKINK